jgi:DNA-directed RNA polymerase specialized sigma24 family protein
MPTREQRLSRINTCWQQVREAHADAELPAGRAALWGLLERYGGAVERYLIGALRDEEAAAELAQEFAVEFLKGAARGADPQRGRFRDYVKGVLQHLIANHFRKGKRRPGHLPTEFPELADGVTSGERGEETFAVCWREELLGRAWQALAALEANSGQPYHTVLKHRADFAEQSSEDMAAALSERLGRPLNAPAVRKALQRAREKFADALLADLTASLRGAAPDALEQELIELRLYEYCKPALERKRS